MDFILKAMGIFMQGKDILGSILKDHSGFWRTENELESSMNTSSKTIIKSLQKKR